MEPQPSLGKLIEEIAATLEQFKLPGLDTTAFMQSRRKDVKALAEANRVALAGLRDLAQKQAEILQKTLRELQAIVQDGSIAQSPTQLGDVVQNTLRAALANMRDLAEMARKSQTEAFGIVSDRVQRNIEELKASILSRKG